MERVRFKQSYVVDRMKARWLMMPTFYGHVSCRLDDERPGLEAMMYGYVRYVRYLRYYTGYRHPTLMCWHADCAGDICFMTF